MTSEEKVNLLYKLRFAMVQGNAQEVGRLRNAIGIKDDYEKLCAKMRFLDIGMASTYEESLALYNQEAELNAQIKKTDETIRVLEAEVWSRVNYEAGLLGDGDPYGSREYERVQSELADSERELREAKKSLDYWRDCVTK